MKDDDGKPTDYHKCNTRYKKILGSKFPDIK